MVTLAVLSSFFFSFPLLLPCDFFIFSFFIILTFIYFIFISILILLFFILHVCRTIVNFKENLIGR